MSYCFNLSCTKPQNPSHAKFCQNCGMRLMLGDRYRAVQRISSGESRTFAAIDTQKLTHSRCILKQFSNGSGAEAFRHEVARLDQIGQHPQIPDLFAYFERGAQQYFVQEFVAGRNLLQQMTEEGSFDDAQIRQLLHDLLPVLQFLHDRQILHRDIKPTNLIRRSDGELVLVDFGSAKHATRSALARTGTVLGSAEYAAPEQMMGKAIAPSDLYSLGVTCIHLLTGLRPFDLYSSTDGAWLWRSVAGEVSSDLAGVLDRLLQNDASQRYQSAAQVMQAIGLSPATTVRVSAVPSAAPQIWQCKQTVTANAPIRTAALAPDQQTLVVGGDDALQVWRLDRNEQFTLAKHPPTVTAVAFANEQMLISGGSDRTLRCWDLPTGKLRQTLVGHTDAITAIALSADGSTLISSSRDRTVKQWRLATGQLLHTSAEQTSAVESLAADQQFLASGAADGTLQVWHLGTQELLRTLPRSSAAAWGTGGAIAALALDASCSRLISASWDMKLALHNLHTGGLRHSFAGHLLPVTAVALSPDRQILATGSHDATLRLWQIASGQSVAVLSGHTGTVSAIVFQTDDCLISGGHDGTLRCWQRQ